LLLYWVQSPDNGDLSRGFADKGVCRRVAGWASTLIGLLSVLSLSQLAVALVNWLCDATGYTPSAATHDFSKGIPPEFRTLAVVPTMLISAQNIEDLIEALEVRFWQIGTLTCTSACLTDFRDARRKR